MKINLSFKHVRKLTNDDVVKCQALIASIRYFALNNNMPTGAQLAYNLDDTPQGVRKTIQLIREHNEEFLPGEFLISHNKGYEITSNKKQILQWAHKAQVRGNSAFCQVDQAWKVGKKKW